MRTELATTTARTSVDFNQLRNQLEAKAKMAPPALKAGGPGDVTMSRRQTDNVVDEILAAAKKGVNVRPYCNARSLIGLLKKADQSIPPEFLVDHEDQHYNFHWVEFGFSVLPESDQFARSAEFGVVITDGLPSGPRKTRPVRLFPDRKDISLFSVDVEGAIGLDSKFDIAVPGGTVIPYVDLAANARLKTNVVFGPFSFRFRRAALEVIGTGDETMYWRYNLKSELRGANEFQSIAVLKVPVECTQVTLKTALRVVVCKRSWLFFSSELPTMVADRDIVVELGKN